MDESMEDSKSVLLKNQVLLPNFLRFGGKIFVYRNPTWSWISYLKDLKKFIKK